MLCLFSWLVNLSQKIMIIGNSNEQQNESQNQENYSEVSSNSPSKSPQCIVFPYIGPPGAGPGLLGSRPGVNNIEYLNALEHHAASLKSALTIVEMLKSSKNKNLDVEIVYDSICDIETELNNQRA